MNPGGVLQYPYSVGVDGQGNLFFTDIQPMTVYELTNTGNVLNLSNALDDQGYLGPNSVYIGVNSAGYVAAGSGSGPSGIDMYDPTVGMWIEQNPPNAEGVFLQLCF
jgi:hypothetical protein